MRIVTLNANGIRSAARKGFFDWLQEQDADVVCIQETKAQVDQLTDPVFRPAGYIVVFHSLLLIMPSVASPFLLVFLCLPLT